MKLPAMAGDWSTGKIFSRGLMTAGYLSVKEGGESSSSYSNPRSLILKLVPFAVHEVFSLLYTSLPGLS